MSTIHWQLSDAELWDAGIGPGTIRLSIGIEDSGDLILDLADSLAKIKSINAAWLEGVGKVQKFNLADWQDPGVIRSALARKRVAIVGMS